MNNKIFAFVLFFVINCTEKNIVYNHTANEVDLGDNFYYLADGKESQILFNLKPKAKSKFGRTVIPSEVVKYNYDNKYIIAQTTENNSGSELYRYWIINKEQKLTEVITPFDSANFYKQIDSLKLKIKLKHRE